MPKDSSLIVLYDSTSWFLKNYGLVINWAVKKCHISSILIKISKFQKRVQNKKNEGFFQIVLVESVKSLLECLFQVRYDWKINCAEILPIFFLKRFLLM